MISCSIGWSVSLITIVENDSGMKWGGRGSELVNNLLWRMQEWVAVFIEDEYVYAPQVEEYRR